MVAQGVVEEKASRVVEIVLSSVQGFIDQRLLRMAGHADFEALEAVGLSTTPYHAHVPSFGEWGFVLASRRPWRMPESLPEGLQFLSPQTLPLLFDFPLDMARVPAEVQRLSNQVLVHTYEREWGRVVAH